MKLKNASHSRLKAFTLCVYVLIFYVGLHAFNAVSYTHLDVYKRQVQEYIFNYFF